MNRFVRIQTELLIAYIMLLLLLLLLFGIMTYKMWWRKFLKRMKMKIYHFIDKLLENYIKDHISKSKLTMYFEMKQMDEDLRWTPCHSVYKKGCTSLRNGYDGNEMAGEIVALPLYIDPHGLPTVMDLY